MNNLTAALLVLTVLLILLPAETYAFGAGEIPDFAYLNDKAFRHGDIENVLSELAKTAGHAAASGGLFSFAQSVLGAATGGSKFSSQDVKRVYFGNWLRDYSQAMDIAGLSKLSADTLVLIVSVLGFLTFGFATEEYQVTAERLGVYLPVEHIDNPSRGYAEKEGDARQFHPKLRPPVNPEELEIDSRTGMKKYMASEGRGWDTSTAHVRRTFRACIAYGRRSRGEEGADLWEAYRLLGTGLHTMEDLLAHSNWCELALRKMGHEQVFCHVGDDVLIDTPNGEAPPLVTGTFGSADFMHSLMGEATDHLSQASVVDLSKNLANASQNQADSSMLRNILDKLPIGGGSDDTEAKMSQAEVMKEKSQAYRFDPDDVAPPEVQQQLWELLQWRDSIYREVLGMIEMVPGLESLMDALSNVLNAYVYTILAPYLTPILQQVTEVLSEGSKAVIDTEDQYEVFDNPNASDPSHSLLSKDHFGLILNEPAGKIAQVVVRYSVQLIVEAWFDDRINPDEVIDRILEAFHHPYFNIGRSSIQHAMLEEMEKWLGAHGSEEIEQIVGALTKESVRAGKNKRQGADDDLAQSGQVYGQVHGQSSQPPQGGGYGPPSAGYGNSQSQPSPGRQQYESSSGRYETPQVPHGAQSGQGYGQPRPGYDGYNQEGPERTGGYGSQERAEYKSSEGYPSESRYGGQQIRSVR
ncbi:hypothetical protein NM688_g8205 [Phlebia brevispora]|uniref:Uncharacterized protein n=1 Tax=Phlebia brevispora TaxID=194682 RepID=A0ACC1RVY3_9APHY|nr:hypothetical protein NM688_g8205 [Phlebia brevispora]